MRNLAGLTFLILLGACHASRPPQSCPQLDRMDMAQAKADARRAFARGDRRLLALGGIVPEKPAAEGLRLPVRYLPATEDYTSEACGSARLRAKRYAEAYNTTMLALLHTKTVK
jgi:hypothetical protein